eukprot:10410094-Prorocentrum_lima.AAC.1
MAGTDDKAKYTIAKKFNNKGRAEFIQFKGNLKDILHFHKLKLHTVLFTGDLHKSVLRSLAKTLADDGITEEADIKARTDEFIESCLEDAFAILMINISDETLKKRL